MPAAERPNAEWVAGLSQRAPGVQTELRAFLHRRLVRTFAGRGLGEAACEDLVQEALLRIFDRLDSFRGESSFLAWALSLTLRLGFDELRHRRWKDVPLDSLGVAPGAVVELATDGPEEAERGLARRRVLRALREALANALTDRQRQVLAAELQGMPQVEIAARLGIQRNALYKLAHDARRRTRRALEAQGLTPADVAWAFA